MQEGIKIERLSHTYLDSTIALVDSVFHEDIALQEIKDSLKESKDTLLSKEYFIALDSNNNVVGTTGLYTIEDDYRDTYWLGWYCVHPDYRGMKIGKKLLDYATKLAKERGKKYLRLFTSDLKEEEKAQQIYEQNGFYVTHQEDTGGYKIIYRKKDLYID